MLRSLVGSEMCIRDSTRTSGFALNPIRLSFFVISQHSFKMWLHANKTRSCLLYTSDAADDLLCVDLGGRRIIKKKKQKNT